MSERVDGVEKRLGTACGCAVDYGKRIADRFLPQVRCLAQQVRVDAVPCEKPVTNGKLFKVSPDIPPITLCNKHITAMLDHHFCPICGFLCSNRPYARCKLKHRVHLYCLAAAPFQDCPHCGDPIIEETLSKPHYQVPAGIHGAITFPEEHLKKIYSNRGHGVVHYPISRTVHVEGEDVGLVELIPKSSECRWLQEEAENEVQLAKRMPTRVGSPGGLLLQISKMLMRDENFQLHTTILAGTLEQNQLKKAMLAAHAPGIEATLTKLHCGKKPIEWAIFLCGKQEKIKTQIADITPLDILHKLLGFGLHAHFTDISNETPLFVSAIREMSISAMETVAQYFSATWKNQNGASALDEAVRTKNAEVVIRVLDHFPELINSTDDRKNSVFHIAAELKLTNIFHILASQKGCCFCEEKIRKCEGLCRENLRNADGKMYTDLCGADSADNVLQLLTSAGARKNQLPAYVLTADLSRGREKTPVQVYNEFDTDKVPEFVYCTKTHFGQDAQVDTSVENMQTCSCGDVCNSEKCECVALSEKVYYNSEGLLAVSVALGTEKCQVPVIYECSDLCGCDPRKCRNRATTKGVSYLMEVHKTREMGWGVRAVETIPKGAYIADYCGEMITNSSCDDREDSYLFELGITNGSKFNYTIDAKRVGGFSRFFNHKCDPNMIAIRVFREHQDFRFPNFAFFAIKEISKGEEIGFDYGDEFWKVKKRYFTCKCGSMKCKWS